MKYKLALGLILAAIAQPSSAADDGRMVTLQYQPGKPIELGTAINNSITVVFSPEERITQVQAADPTAFNVSSSSNGDSVVIKLLRNPATPDVTIRTQLRDYNFMIETRTPAESVYVARFNYSAIPGSATAGYRLSGTKALLPSRISDDGVHTYLEWPEDEALPAVFAVNSIGEEEMVDGYMRGGVFTIDRVNDELVFRLGKKMAKAVRNAG